MEKKKILVIGNVGGTAGFVETYLGRERYGFTRVGAPEALASVDRPGDGKPDMVLLDLDVFGGEGFEFCRRLKSGGFAGDAPIMAVSALKSNIPDRLLNLKDCADTFLLSPLNADELRFYAEKLLLGAEEPVVSDPLTQLPGIQGIEKEFEIRLQGGEKFSAAYIDIDNFKSFNDIFGFQNGNRVIKHLGKIIKSAAGPDNFAGHLGGDDFMVITAPEEMDNICADIIKQFDTDIINYYNSKDFQNGAVRISDPVGIIREVPVLSISIGVTGRGLRKIRNYGELVDFLVEMKTCVKSRQDRKGSLYLNDRRILRDSPAEEMKHEEQKKNILNPFM